MITVNSKSAREKGEKKKKKKKGKESGIKTFFSLKRKKSKESERQKKKERKVEKEIILHISTETEGSVLEQHKIIPEEIDRRSGSFSTTSSSKQRPTNILESSHPSETALEQGNPVIVHESSSLGAKSIVILQDDT
ncbi:hypothetical protein ADUPG1_008554, partial [Aduncisulcus paluster]